jgi:hypothetical protein
MLIKFDIWKEQECMWIIPWKRNVSEMFLSRLLLYTSKDQKHLSFPTLSISNIFHYTLFGFHFFIHSLVFEFSLFSFLAVKKIETWPVVEQYYVFFCLQIYYSFSFKLSLLFLVALHYCYIPYTGKVSHKVCLCIIRKKSIY